MVGGGEAGIGDNLNSTNGILFYSLLYLCINQCINQFDFKVECVHSLQGMLYCELELTIAVCSHFLSF